MIMPAKPMRGKPKGKTPKKQSVQSLERFLKKPVEKKTYIGRPIYIHSAVEGCAPVSKLHYNRRLRCEIGTGVKNHIILVQSLSLPGLESMRHSLLWGFGRRQVLFDVMCVKKCEHFFKLMKNANMFWIL